MRHSSQFGNIFPRLTQDITSVSTNQISGKMSYELSPRCYLCTQKPPPFNRSFHVCRRTWAFVAGSYNFWRDCWVGSSINPYSRPRAYFSLRRHWPYQKWTTLTVLVSNVHSRPVGSSFIGLPEWPREMFYVLILSLRALTKISYCVRAVDDPHTMNYWPAQQRW